MTVINTNIAALSARTYALQATDKMETAMERLSSGLRINSAADDAAGLSVANKMESQLRGIDVAIRNSQDGISLVQTAEAGMSEITNMVVRMRELSVQMNNGVYTDGDRANAQLEVTALLAEVDKIASNTAFNSVKVLDGTYSTSVRAGNTNAESIDVVISSNGTKTLGEIAALSTLANSSATGTRTTASQVTTSAVSAKESTEVRVDFTTDMQTFATNNAAKTLSYALSGTDAGDFTVDSSNNRIKDSVTLVDGNSKAVTLTLTARSNSSAGTETASTATGSAVATAATVEESNAVTIAKSSALTAYIAGAGAPVVGSAEYVITGGTDASDFSIVSGTGVLSNSSASSLDVSGGATRNVQLTVFDRRGTSAGANTNEVTVSGTIGSSTTTINTAFEVSDTVTIAKTNGLIEKLADDGTTINASDNVANNIDVAVTHTGGANVGGATAFAFDGTNIVGTNINFNTSATYTIVATATLKVAAAELGTAVGTYAASASATATLAATMDNATSMTVGVKSGTGTASAIAANGANAVITSAFNSAAQDISSLLTIDNSTGVISLASGSGQIPADTYTIKRTVTHDGDTNGVVNTYAETITLVVTDYKHTDTYTVTATDSAVVATDNITLTSTASDKFVDNIALSVTANVDHLADVDVSTQAGAARAVTILDQALNTLSSSQAKLGAIQNRLSHNIDNLSTSSMLTETARGRILDADFARETSELSKQQILGQAATSMLAQANQSKQSILALLQ
jgi:flagellin